MKKVSLFRRARSKVGSALVGLRLSDSRRNEALRSQSLAFGSLGLSLESATSTTLSTLDTSGLTRLDPSMHYELFAAISEIQSVNKILEIGTSSGHFTEFLAHLCPNAIIETWDLPSESFADNSVEAYERIRLGYGDQTSESHSRLNHLKNLVQIRKDSTRLAFHSESYDMIWVDGDHTFPVVAFDVINSLRLLRVNGWLCVDDIKMREKKDKLLGSLETYKTVKHLKDSGLVSLTLIPKNLSATSILASSNARKYIAVMRRLV